MKHIRETIKRLNPTLDDLINCFEIVKKNGDVAVIKFDGERNEKEYTVFISFPTNTAREMIRADENTLKEALVNTLTRYVDEREDMWLRGKS